MDPSEFPLPLGTGNWLIGVSGYSLTTNIFIHLGLSVLDIGISAAAGAAAAATGAHVEGVPTTEQILQLGALGGLIKSGIINCAHFISMTTNNTFLTFLAAFAASTFGAAVLITLAISQNLFSDVPNALIIAAAAAGAPMIPGAVMIEATGPVASSLSIGWDALAGYTFARVAQNHGYHACEYKSAAVAGAVFGPIVWFMKLPPSIYMESKQESKPVDSGVYEMNICSFSM